ncbi:MAG: hypothetical protein EBX07_09255 [Burkholderiaceae bacterium]|nr:hypothetical protein [Burkholderiaceae bacterium]
MIAEIEAEAQACQNHTDPDLQLIGHELHKATQALAKALNWLLTAHNDQPQATLAGAYPLLRSFGILCGGWLLAKSALIVNSPSYSGQNGFASQKKASAIFYTHEVLPHVAGLVQTICAGADVAKAMNDGLADLMNP